MCCRPWSAVPHRSFFSPTTSSTSTPRDRLACMRSRFAVWWKRSGRSSNWKSSMVHSPAGRTRRWLRHPLLLLPAKAAVVIATMIFTVRLFAHHRGSAATQLLLIDPVTIFLLLAIFIVYTRYVEARAVTELAP